MTMEASVLCAIVTDSCSSSPTQCSCSGPLSCKTWSIGVFAQASTKTTSVSRQEKESFRYVVQSILSKGRRSSFHQAQESRSAIAGQPFAAVDEAG